MITSVLANLLRFVLLVLLQVLVIDHIDLVHGWVLPYLYVLFIIMLPFDTPVWATLLLGFLLGLVLDLFSSTPGLHASACVVMAYARVFTLRALAPREGYDVNKRPTVPHMGLAWFMTFSGITVLLHHLWLFFAETYRFDHFFSTLFRVLVSTAATLLLCLLTQALTSRSTGQR